MRIDVELFAGGESGTGALLTGPVMTGVVAEIHRHPRANGGNEAAPTHELRLVASCVVLSDVALWKKSSDRGDYLSGSLLKGHNWWVNVNYLDQDAPSGAVAKLTVRHQPPKQGAATGGDDGTGGRF